MKRVLVLGGGYAGLSAAARLARRRPSLSVELIDARDAHHALPILPDVVGRAFRPRSLRYSLQRAAARFGFTFRCETVRAIHADAPSVKTDQGVCEGDALLVATGTRTSSLGLDFVGDHAYTLDDLEDAERLRHDLADRPWQTAVVCGGGYTGVELATAVRRWSRRQGLARRILLADLAPTLCPLLAETFQQYVTRNVESVGISVRTETSVEDAGDDWVQLSDGERIERALLLWSVGKAAPACVQEMPARKTKQGRLHVDPTLRFGERCFAAGDAAAFEHDGAPLRMSVQFALTQGRHAAKNILRALDGAPLLPFRPYDPGYLVPMANDRACGEVLGCPVYGRIGIALHYLMCIARSVGFGNRRRTFADVVRSFAGGY